MANLNLPTPVVIAGAGLCLLGGYLIGVVAGPDTPERTTGTVDSYNARTNELCLSGDAVGDQDGAERRRRAVRDLAADHHLDPAARG